MTTKTKKQWSVLTDRFVAVIKIVDYKKIKEENSEHDFFEKILFIKDVVDNPDYQLLKSCLINDTLFLVTNHSSNEYWVNLYGAIIRIQMQLFEAGIATKGGLAEGRVLADFKTMTFAGDALIEASEIADSINLYAVARNNQDNKSDDKDIPERTAEEIPLDYPMDVPTQNGMVNMNVINSVIFSQEKNTADVLLCNVADKPFYADTLAVFKEIHAYAYLDEE